MHLPHAYGPRIQDVCHSPLIRLGRHAPVGVVSPSLDSPSASRVAFAARLPFRATALCLRRARSLHAVAPGYHFTTLPFAAAARTHLLSTTHAPSLRCTHTAVNTHADTFYGHTRTLPILLPHTPTTFPHRFALPRFVLLDCPRMLHCTRIRYCGLPHPTALHTHRLLVTRTLHDTRHVGTPRNIADVFHAIAGARCAIFYICYQHTHVCTSCCADTHAVQHCPFH